MPDSALLLPDHDVTLCLTMTSLSLTWHRRIVWRGRTDGGVEEEGHVKHFARLKVDMELILEIGPNILLMN